MLNVSSSVAWLETSKQYQLSLKLCDFMLFQIFPDWLKLFQKIERG